MSKNVKERLIIQMNNTDYLLKEIREIKQILEKIKKIK